MREKRKLPYTVILICVTVVLYLLGKAVGSESLIGRGIEPLTFLSGLLAVYSLWMKYTKEGRRMKEKFIDPLVKPQGVEKQYWDEKGGPRCSADAPSPYSQKDSSETQLNLRRRQRGKLRIIIVVAVLLVCFVIVMGLSSPKNAIEEMKQDSEEMSQLFDGLKNGESQDIFEGGSVIFHSIFRDLKLLAIWILVFVIVFVVIWIVRKIQSRRKKFRFEEDDRL